MIYQNAKDLIGNTPIYEFLEGRSHIYVKLEKYNPAGSIKDRAVLGMLQDALEKGKIKGEMFLLRPQVETQALL